MTEDAIPIDAIWSRFTAMEINLMKKQTTAIVTIISIVLILVGVAAYKQYILSITPQERTSVKFGLIPIADAAPVFVAIEQGYFEEEGIQAETKTIRGGSLISKGQGINLRL
jgi:NitT/TauT family transport system substrate-binding protein